ncbi:MAG: methylated-DNA--[protein]-cysteine S-methyltransferase [Vicinamibacterales bacterium]
MIELAVVQTPIGPLTLAARSGRICLLHFGDDERGARATVTKWYGSVAISSAPDPAGAATVLRDYFAGNLDALDVVEVEMNGTDFQRRVWTALRGVKAGTTVSYSQVAAAVGSPAAVRAVGAANGANPVAVVVPCHRIIGANGTLTGYGGGLERKQWLLRHEGGRLF